MTQPELPRKVVIITHGATITCQLVPAEVERLLTEWRSRTADVIGTYTYQQGGRARTLYLWLDQVIGIDVDTGDARRPATSAPNPLVQ